MQEKRGCTIPDEKRRNDLIKTVHDRGHFGVTAIFRDLTIKQKLWWPGMLNHISFIIKQCRPCQEYTIVKTGYHPSQSVKANKPGDHWMIDLIEMTESTDHMKYILTVVDVFTDAISITF